MNIFKTALIRTRRALHMSQWRLEYIVLGLVLFFGLWFVFLVPPGHNVDEENHVLRVWQIASNAPTEGENRSGAKLPTALGDLFEASKTPYRVDFSLKFGDEERQAIRSITVNEQDRRSYEFPNTITYAPFAYTPMVPAVWAGQAFNWPVAHTITAMRILGLIATAALLALAVRVTARGKWIIAVVALLPMTVAQAASVSADGITIAVCLLFIAYTLRLAFAATKPTYNQALFLLVIMTSLALTKTAYLPLLALLLVIPILNPEVRTKRTVALGVGLALVPLVLGTLWALSVKDVSLLYSPYTDQADRLPHLLAQPVQVLELLYHTFFTSSPAYDMNKVLGGFWGSFGWNNIALPFMYVLFSIIAVTLTVLLVPKEEERYALTPKSRALLFSVFIGTACLVAVGLYAIISSGKEPAATFVQGRYFIPIAPVGLLALHGLFRLQPNRHIRTVIMTLCLIVLVGAVITVGRRFYDPTYL